MHFSERKDMAKGKTSSNRTVAVANRKGGCCKTTTVGALASGLTQQGYKVLAVDMDPQGNLTDWAGFDTEDKDTVYEVVMQRSPVNETIVHLDRYDLLPADAALANVEAELANVQGREYRLREALEPIASEYDFIVIDTPPNLGLLTIQSFAAAADGVVVTTDAGSFATKGMRDLAESLSMTRKYINPNARVIGILLTKFNPRWNTMKTMKEVTEKFSEYFDAPLYQTFIRQSVGVMTAQLESIDIYDMDKNIGAVSDYQSFVKEFINNITK